MAETQAIYYRDKRGVEAVDRFIESLPAKRAAKIDDYIAEHLNGQAPDAPPPKFPVSSQIEGELRELTGQGCRRALQAGMHRRIVLDSFIHIDKHNHHEREGKRQCRPEGQSGYRGGPGPCSA